ncbi:ArnT family glycosyltransferase, partial [Pantoea ananatis]
MVNTKNYQSVFPVTRATGPERFLLRKFASKSNTHAYATMPFLPAPQQISLVLCVLVFICWLLPGLFGHEPWKPDEAYTFGLIRHIAQTGDWVVPTLAGEPFMEKPPLYFIVASFFLRLFSPLLGEPDAARMATGFFIVLACYAIALSARELFGKGAGRWAVLILFACLGFPVRAHQMITDIALLAGGATGIYGFILGIRRHVLGGAIL